MGADILERLDFMLISRRSDEDAIIRDARAEIVRLRGEVKKLADDVQVPPDPTAHRWNDDGERCLICGDKDWMGGPCSGGAVSATVNGVNGLVVKWRESAASAKRYSVTEYEDGCASAEKRCADELESAIRSSEHLATAGVRTASIAPAEAKGPAPAMPNGVDGLAYAQRLAVAIWSRNYREVSPQWEVCEDLMGVLSQIDNMVSGMSAADNRDAAGVSVRERDCTQEAADKFYQDGWNACLAANTPAAVPAGEAVAWDDFPDGDDSYLHFPDSNARYEVRFSINENHGGVWRAAFNPDAELDGAEQPIGTFATKSAAQAACLTHHTTPQPAQVQQEAVAEEKDDWFDDTLASMGEVVSLNTPAPVQAAPQEGSDHG